jgi:hypothetical protein
MYQTDILINLLISILGSLIATFLETRINNNFVKNNTRTNDIPLVDISTNRYHYTPLTCLGNGKFGDHC